MIYAIAICFVYCIINAEWDAWKFRGGKKADHNANGGLYIALVIGLCVGLTMIEGYKHTVWLLIIALFCERQLVFDNYLNLRRRDRPINYHPLKPEAWLDRQEIRIFRKDIWERSNLTYLIIFIFCVVFI